MIETFQVLSGLLYFSAQLRERLAAGAFLDLGDG